MSNCQCNSPLCPLCYVPPPTLDVAPCSHCGYSEYQSALLLNGGLCDDCAGVPEQIADSRCDARFALPDWVYHA